MSRFSCQVSEELLAALQDLALREGKSFQQMLRDILQAVVDGDDPGRVVSAGTREAIDTLRDEQRRSGTALAQAVTDGLQSIRDERGEGEAARVQVLVEAVESLQKELARGRAEDRAERESLTVAVRDLQGRVDSLLESRTPPAPDESRRGLRNPFRGGGG